MAAAVFDTLTAAETLRDAGSEAEQAAAIAHTVNQAVGDNLATKADLSAAVAELRAELSRALWIQGAGIVGVLGTLLAIATAIVKFLP